MDSEAERLAWRIEHEDDALLAEMEAEIQAQVDAVGDVSNGAVLRHEHAARWAFVLPDVEPGSWRVQLFDERGFAGHFLCIGAAEAVHCVVVAGYQHRDEGALDRVAALSSFQRGNYIADLVDRVNFGELSLEQYRAQVHAYDHGCRAGVA